jgi:DNA helicase-2/ATP-dependent DNA helicase PcrA
MRKSTAAEADVWAGMTFHRHRRPMLRRHCERLEYPASFSIFDSERPVAPHQGAGRGREAGRKRCIRPRRFGPTSRPRKKRGALPSARAHASATLFGVRAEQIYARYQERLRKLGAMDFGDLIVNVVELYRRCPDLLGRYQRRFRYVLVDEYQDTNHAST